MQQNSPNFTYTEIDTIHKGPYNARTATKVSYVEFSSTAQRDAFLKQHKDTTLTFTDPAHTPLRLDKKKPKRQDQRNYALHHAKELLEKHELNTNKTVKINWKLNNSRDRNVTVNGTPTFLQLFTDDTGTFTTPFESLNF